LTEGGTIDGKVSQKTGRFEKIANQTQKSKNFEGARGNVHPHMACSNSSKKPYEKVSGIYPTITLHAHGSRSKEGYSDSRTAGHETLAHPKKNGRNEKTPAKTGAFLSL
jgi:hypothetical protein